MASLTAADQTVSLSMLNKGETVAVALSGTYAATTVLQREVGSLGSGQWEDLKSWSTANATVAFSWITQRERENLRLTVRAFTSGTIVATLTDATDQEVQSWKNLQGQTLMRLTEKGLELSGALRQLASPAGPGGSGIYSITASVTLTREDHAGKLGMFDVAGGATVTLPAATGTGDKYRFRVKTTLTSSGIIKVANSTDVIKGVVAISTDVAGITMLATGTDDTVTMNGSTTGGLAGSYVELEDFASGFWGISGGLVSTGAEATPFSATV